MKGTQGWLLTSLIAGLFVMTCLAIWLNLAATRRGYAVHDLYEQREDWRRRLDEQRAEINRLRAPAPMQDRLKDLQGEEPVESLSGDLLWVDPEARRASSR